MELVQLAGYCAEYMRSIENVLTRASLYMNNNPYQRIYV